MNLSQKDLYNYVLYNELLKQQQPESPPGLNVTAPHPPSQMQVNDDIVLTERQQYALEIMKRGENILLTGMGGTGKSYVINCFKDWCEVNHRTIAVTSTTGASAILIGGRTLHSWAGIGLGTKSVEALVKKINDYRTAKQRWCSTHVLVIDEVSMLDAELFDKLCEIGRCVTGTGQLFGGIQLVLSGDFCQLEPVKSNRFCFESDYFSELIDEIVYLQEIHRQTDQAFKEALNEMRMGVVTQSTIKMLTDRIRSRKELRKLFSSDNGIIPTKLFALNKDVDHINNTELQKIITDANQVETFQATYSFNSPKRPLSNKQRETFKDMLSRSTPVLDTLKLAVGAQVMLRYNMDTEGGLVNGSRGVVTDINDMFITVKFMCRQAEIPVLRWQWTLQIDDHIEVTKVQFPLSLAYAMTIHKAQGCTLDYALMDIGPKIFTDGQAYTALSRIRSLDGLYLMSFEPKKVTVNKKVKEFYKKLEENNG